MSASPVARVVRSLAFATLLPTFVAAADARASAQDVFLPPDREDLVAAIRQCDPAGARRIRERLDAIIDELRDAVAAAKAERGAGGAGGDDGKRPAKEKGRAKKAKDEGRGGKAERESILGPELQARLASAVSAWRLSQLSHDLSPKEGSSFWKALEQSPAFAQTLALAVDPAHDKLSGVWQVATDLVMEDAPGVDAHPELAAAIATVYDDGNLSLHVNENVARAPGAKLAWKWFTTKAGDMRFGVDLAPELLSLVVDVPAGLDDIGWAFKSFQGTQKIGPLYFQVQYDFESLEGKPKKVDVAGWNLPNILKHGGICADQAYFATTVAKSLGIPAVYTVGQDATVGHAWAGYVEVQNKRPVWEVSGRYDSYKGVTGMFRNPRTGENQNDAVLAMLVEWGLEPKADRVASSILRMASERIETRLREAAKGARPEGEARKDVEVLDAAKVDELHELREALLFAAIRRCPTDVRSWYQLRDLGAEGGLERSAMELWFGRIVDLCGTKYPEMVLEVSAPMIASVKDDEDQHGLWTSLADFLSKRADLASQAMMKDGEMWERASDDERAAKAYDQILKHYPDSGPPTETALRKLAAMFERRGEGRKLLALYDNVWSKMSPPKEMPNLFGKSSTWYRVGSTYADLLRKARRENDASAVRAKLEKVVGTKPDGKRS